MTSRLIGHNHHGDDAVSPAHGCSRASSRPAMSFSHSRPPYWRGLTHRAGRCRYAVLATGADMNDLLESAVAAHGGLDRWNQLTSITVDVSITGALWHVKGKPDVLKDVRLTTDTKRQMLAMDFVGQDKRSVFEPSRVVIE